MSSAFLTPQYVLSGENALESSVAYLRKYGDKALIVTDTTMVRVGNIRRLTDVLGEAGIRYVTYDQVNSEPVDDMVAAGKRLYQANFCNFLIAIGGGSPIDTMKAIGAMLTNPGQISDYLGKVIPNAAPPMVAVPTTAGTGSEATQFTIITDTRRDIKMLLKGPELIPRLAIVDYRFSMTAPQKVTAATGLDALTHAIESYTSRKAQPLSDMFALDAVKRIFHSLRRAFDDGADEAARRDMSLAALEAGISFNNSSVTIVHGMSRPIGALFHVPHGLSNAMLLPRCLTFALPGAAGRFARLAEILGLWQPGMSDQEAGRAFIGAVADLCRHLKIDTPASFGIDREKYFDSLDKMTEDALASGSPANTRREVDAEDIKTIYRDVWNEV